MKHCSPGDHFLQICYLILFVASLAGGADLYDFLFPTAAPEVTIINPQGKDHDGDSFCYWVASSCIIDLHLRDSRHAVTPFDLSLDLVAAPANRSPYRSVELMGESGGPQIANFRGRQLVHFPILLKYGPNRFTLRVVAPTEWQVHIPGDPRKHLLRIESIGLKRVSLAVRSALTAEAGIPGNLCCFPRR